MVCKIYSNTIINVCTVLLSLIYVYHIRGKGIRFRIYIYISLDLFIKDINTTTNYINLIPNCSICWAYNVCIDPR